MLYKLYFSVELKCFGALKNNFIKENFFTKLKLFLKKHFHKIEEALGLRVFVSSEKLAGLSLSSSI